MGLSRSVRKKLNLTALVFGWVMIGYYKPFPHGTVSCVFIDGHFFAMAVNTIEGNALIKEPLLMVWLETSQPS